MTVQNAILILLSFAGLLVCRQGLNKDAFYRSGYQFFLLFLLTAVYKLIYSSLSHIFVAKLHEAGLTLSQIGKAMTLGQMPGLVLELLAFFLLVLGFYRYYRDLEPHTRPEETAGEQGEEGPPMIIPRGRC